ncbi:HC-toxin synthetase [Fulvia fulva]|uniref:HC-toxin synthetase n=1 Tax=Passalora fulva TaxID=5499 RepID=A0A9Q8P5A3_PASFU|nr:HC-toxin synthetase [Fulvia fulva]KAK4632553.1 HC-toxin synthetase [Fulvia fulva]UJO13681.1 HC-toxin synthetase [Fulvia fulva]WPV10784.1 HC-toxin synthetase [Fulvia fulva]
MIRATAPQAASSSAASSCLELALLVNLHIYSSDEVVSFRRLVRNGTASQVSNTARVRGVLKPGYGLDRIIGELEDIAHSDGENVIDHHGCLGPFSAVAIQYSSCDSNITIRPSMPIHSNLCLEICCHYGEAGAEVEVRMSLVYRRSSMSRREATRFVRVLTSIVEQICIRHTSNQGVASLSVKDLACHAFEAVDRNRVLAWNSKQALQSQETLIHNVFSSVAVKHADREAIVGPNGCMTYAILHETSSAIASYLRKHLTAEDRWLALYFAKSSGMWAIAGMLAVLKTGRGCTFLDTSWPDERLCVVIRATGTRFLLTHGTRSAHRVARLQTETHLQSFDVAQAATASTIEDPEEAHDSTVRPGDGAFVVFTSGSTGSPKGVVLTHANVCTAITGLIERLAINPSHGSSRQQVRVLQFAAYAFDASLSDMLVALLSGAAACIPSDTERTSNLQSYMKDQNVTIAFLTPTVARRLVPSSLDHTLKTLVLIGEPVTSLDKDQWLGSAIDVFNGYGPTESTFAASLGRIRLSKSPSNIGLPLGYRFWVVNCNKGGHCDSSDLDGRYLIPIGATGELVLEGPALAQCYLNDAKLTQSRFKTGSAWLPIIDGQALLERRVYGTGDLVRYHEDGSLECLGRVENDTQVKLAGQRLELAEIEHHLAQGAAIATTPFCDAAVSDLPDVFVNIVLRDNPSSFELRQLHEADETSSA